jgi:pyridoxine 5-phosphate synthase
MVYKLHKEILRTDEMIKLGVNIDHVATLREARRGTEPEPIQAAFSVIEAGADFITTHLREDRRHINDKDVRILKEVLPVPLNLEMALTDEIIKIALEIEPEYVCIVPEKREEVTTEGGLDLLKIEDKLKESIIKFRKKGIKVSLFIEANDKQIECAARVNAHMIELHTGKYANAKGEDRKKELEVIKEGTKFAIKLGLLVNAGHGLNYQNTADIAQIPGIRELNIGHSIISRSIFTGLKEAVKDMKNIIESAQGE